MQNKYNVFGKGDKYKIFIDLKAPTEVSYVKDNNGLIIKIDRPNNIKEKGFDKLENDTRIDQSLYIDGSLYDLEDKIVEIAKNIKNR
jgi:hypothetical protein